MSPPPVLYIYYHVPKPALYHLTLVYNINLFGSIPSNWSCPSEVNLSLSHLSDQIKIQNLSASVQCAGVVLCDGGAMWKVRVGWLGQLVQVYVSVILVGWGGWGEDLRPCSECLSFFLSHEVNKLKTFRTFQWLSISYRIKTQLIKWYKTLSMTCHFQFDLHPAPT